MSTDNSTSTPADSASKIIACILAGLTLDIQSNVQRTALTEACSWRVFLTDSAHIRATADGKWIEVFDHYQWSPVLPQTMKSWLRAENLPEDALDPKPAEPHPSARDLQAPGDELFRHDLAIYFLKHPCELLVFQAQEDACENDADRAELVYQTWLDLIPAYVRYSNRGPVETHRSRFERNHVRIARAAATLRIGGAL